MSKIRGLMWNKFSENMLDWFRFFVSTTVWALEWISMCLNFSCSCEVQFAKLLVDLFFSFFSFNSPFLIVTTFVTKVTEYLCSGECFLLQTNFDFLTSHFWRNSFYHSKVIVTWAQIRKDNLPGIIYRKVTRV